MEWQPIDTALKNGDGILLFVPGYPGEVQAATWSESRDAWCLYGCNSLAFDFDDDEQPTHWMPLPEPPVRK